MKVTVVQFRTDQSGPHEVKCLYTACKIPYESFTFINVLNDGFTSNIRRVMKNTDIFILSGWGEAGYESKDPYWINKLNVARERIFPLIHKAYKDNIPLIGICFGFQVMVDALGGELVVSPEMSEGGIFEISLTPAGRKEKIFAKVGDTFKAVLGHKTSVNRLPEGSIILAKSTRCPIQAVKFTPTMYGFTFHPELTYQDLIERTSLYEGYASNDEAMKYQETATNSILINLIEKFSDSSFASQKARTFSSNSI